MSFDRLLDSCRKLLQQGGADAVKIEGGRDVADDIELVATGISNGPYWAFASDRKGYWWLP